MKKLLYLFAFLMVSSVGAQDFASVIKSYLQNNQSSIGLTSQDVESIAILSNGYSKSMQLHNVYVNQLHNGVEIFNSTSSFAVKNGEVVYAAPSFEADVASRANVETASLTPEAAILNAANSLNISTPTNLELLSVDGNTYLFSNGGVSLNEIPVKLVYQKMEDNSLRLAWDLSIAFLDGSHYYSVRMDATTGTLLDKNDWVVSCSFGDAPHSHAGAVKNTTSVLFDVEETTSSILGGGDSYRVFPIPFSNPDDHATANGEIVVDPADVNASPLGWHDTDGTAGAEFTITRGNNVWAQEDLNGNNGTGASPDGGGTLEFDFPYNLPAAPTDFTDAATVNLFYWNNIIHDYTWQYGFDEENGNFQEFNYSGLGNGGDSVDADAQDGSGQNNANFATPPDGGNPRMQMFLWDGLIVPDILTINAGPLAGTYGGVPAAFGGAIPVPPLTEDIVVIEDDDAGASTDPNDGCDNVTNGPDLNGKIVIINRGACEFGLKALQAQDEGAVAVIIKYIETEGGAIYPFAMGPGANGASVTIPVFMIPTDLGDDIIADVGANGPLNATISGENPAADLDGSLDNEIVAHEYAHGVSNRLTGGPNNTGCLNNLEQMGEGWSDYLGLIMTMQTGDTGEDPRGLAAYAAQNPVGIRPSAYSTDQTINPADYSNLPGYGNGDSPHRTGYVWASMLWDMTWLLIDQYGFDDDLYNGTGGNNIAMQLVMDGMKLQGCGPGFVDGRDAILEADMLLYNGDNQCLIWDAFAGRGLGLSADQGSANDRTDGTPASDVPTTPGCILSTTDNGNFDSNFSIYPNPSNGQINISSKVSLGEAKVSIFDMNGRRVYSSQVEIGNQASIDATVLNTGVYIMKIDGGSYAHTTKLIIQ